MVKPGRGSKVMGELVFCSILFLAMAVNPGVCVEDPAKYPSKPITMIVQFGPGGLTDTTARKMADLGGKGARRTLAATVFPPVPVAACLRNLGRVDSVESNPLSVNLDCVAVNDRRATDK